MTMMKIHLGFNISMRKYFYPILFIIISAKCLLPANTDSQQLSSGPLLSDAVSFEIHRSSDSKIFKITEAAQYPIDLEDMVYIRINKNVLSRFLSEAKSVDNSSEEQLKKLELTLSSIQDLSDIAFQIIEERKRLLAQKDLSNEALIKLVRKYEKKWQLTKNSVLKYIETLSSDPNQAEEKLNELIKDPSNGKLAEYLKTEITRLSDRTTVNIQNIVKDSPLRLRLKAMILSSAKAGSPIHLDGYDDGQPGEFQFRDKLSFVMSPERQEKVEESLETANKIKDIIDRIKTNNNYIEDSLKDYFKPLLSMAANLPNETILKEQIKNINNNIGALKDILSKNIGETAPQSLKKHLPELKANINMPQDIFQLITNVRNLQGPNSELKMISNIGAIIETDISKFPSEVAEILSDMEKSSATLELIYKEVRKDVINKDVEDTVNSLLLSFDEFNAWIYQIKEMANWVKDNMGKDIRKIVDANGFSSSVDNAKWNAYAVPLQNVKDTFIDMNTVPAENQDRLVVSVEILEHNINSDKDDVLSNTKTQLRIASLGWSTNISGDLLFIQKDENSGFMTGTGVSYVYCYRPWREVTSWQKFLTTLNPGLGLSIASLNFSGDSIQCGVGANVILFRGLVNVGYGYNLQAIKGYFFFGLRLDGFSGKPKKIY